MWLLTRTTIFTVKMSSAAANTRAWLGRFALQPYTPQKGILLSPLFILTLTWQNQLSLQFRKYYTAIEKEIKR